MHSSGYCQVNQFDDVAFSIGALTALSKAEFSACPTSRAGTSVILRIVRCVVKDVSFSRMLTAFAVANGCDQKVPD